MFLLLTFCSISAAELYPEHCLTGQLDSTCGRFSTPTRNTRVFGGQISEQGQWPWLTFVNVKGNNPQICTGSFISDSWVVTAGHCIKVSSNYAISRAKLGKNTLAEIHILVTNENYDQKRSM